MRSKTAWSSRFKFSVMAVPCSFTRSRPPGARIITVEILCRLLSFKMGFDK